MAEAMTADGWAFEVRLALDLAAEARQSTAVWSWSGIQTRSAVMASLRACCPAA